MVGTGLHRGWTIAGAVGPIIGAAVAVAIGLGYQALYREAAERGRLIDELMNTREELASTSRDAGKFAERERLAAEIHDTVAQGLSSIQMLLHAAERADPDSPAIRQISLARETAADSLAETRQLIAELTPAALDGQSLADALRRICERASSPELEARSVVEGEAVRLPMPLEATLVRIAQGAVSNVLRHADATRMAVTLTYSDDTVSLDVVDNGRGFDVAVLERGPGGIFRPQCNSPTRRTAGRDFLHRVRAGTHGRRSDVSSRSRRTVIRLLLADDHAIVRAGLRALLESEADIEVVGEAGTAEEAIAFCATTPVDLVLMDLRFGPGKTGVDATRAVCALPNPPHVLVVTNYDTDADILSAVEAGASGYLLKDTPPVELLSAVRAAASGDSVLSPAIASKLMTRVRKPETSLSPREIEVLKLVAAGRSNREIGKELFLSETTVKSHLVHIFGKLGVKSRTSAVARARELGSI